ncbi:unnamed protein product [Orchesella dallaii]|uniref:Uncharacterized protein n=1 Tax=Orchesella dallaii TaxID=48710 RepID=A0ABP1S669_9HEXA
MNNYPSQSGAYRGNGAAGASGVGGTVYQHFSAPSTTFINVFNQPGDYNITMGFAAAAGRVNQTGGGGAAGAGALNRQAPMLVSTQNGEPRGVPMMIPRPNGQIRVPVTPPRTAFTVAPERFQMAKAVYKTPDQQNTTDHPLPPPKPKKFDISVNPRGPIP